MRPILFDRTEALYQRLATRTLEQTAAAQRPPQALMQAAGLAVARLARAVAPHARTVWIACGAGNNGGDGLEAALHLQSGGLTPVITGLGDATGRPADAQAAWQRAQARGLRISPAPPPQADLCIDAVLGLGFHGPVRQAAGAQIAAINASGVPVLSIDLPSGLDGDTGAVPGQAVRARWTLCLLTLKPGLFTAQGRDHSGQVWLDELAASTARISPSAWLLGPGTPPARLHASHKGSYGDVVVIGGAPGMTGAALLAASAALHAGAGRVLVDLLDPAGPAWDTAQPELMFRPADTLALQGATVVCGCGGGDAVAQALPRVLAQATRLVLDADALHALSRDTALQHQLAQRAERDFATVLTPHPLEAARLLHSSVTEVQADRLRQAQALAERFACTVVLKGSGSVIAQPGQVSAINPTGSARLASAGTGDVLAGFIGAALANGLPAWDAACSAVYRHGLHADQWPGTQALSASALAQRG